MSSHETQWTCGECGTTSDYVPEFPGDMPDGWYRLEDRACVYLMCSLDCLWCRAEALEILQTTDVDPSV